MKRIDNIERLERKALIYEEICSFARKNGHTPTIERIMDLTDLPVNAVMNGLKDLEEDGSIIRKEVNDYKAHRVIMLPGKVVLPFKNPCFELPNNCQEVLFYTDMNQWWVGFYDGDNWMVWRATNGGVNPVSDRVLWWTELEGLEPV